jgi:hypothetical protein
MYTCVAAGEALGEALGEAQAQVGGAVGQGCERELDGREGLLQRVTGQVSFVCAFQYVGTAFMPACPLQHYT